MRKPTPRRFTDLTYATAGGVATITIARAKSHNSLAADTLRELALAFTDASWDDAVGVVVLTGEGDKAFCTGGDVKEYVAEYVPRPRDYWKWIGLFRSTLESVLHCGKPVIARVNGMAIGGGNELQLACDLAVAAEHAEFGQVGTSVGSVAALGATQWLPLLVGERRAREMLFLNRRLSAREALEWGLVNRVAPKAKLDAEVAKMAAELQEKFPECLRYTKAQANQNREAVWHATVAHAQDWLALHFATPEPAEGMGAFVGKRKPDVAGLRRRWAEDRSPEFLHGPPVKSCPCGATGLPAGFAFCGVCGKRV